jgi:hypothetical protein
LVVGSRWSVKRPTTGHKPSATDKKAANSRRAVRNSIVMRAQGGVRGYDSGVNS